MFQSTRSIDKCNILKKITNDVENGDICRCVNGENSLYLRFLFAEIINRGKNMALDVNDFNLTQCLLILYVKTKTIGLQYLNGSEES